ncbi:FAD-dependent oxidoreductase [Agrilactobacillus fermenti]|uniref:FAD-dependent oxidoreductase n=1 Tax=Agrilactobacillus fermenti TaxID=2586909 RepID=UPI001E5BEE28|nr:FAD-dependent oxidoreductase [Agrilactobacillus fermenti]MCD2256913.1 FAD-dependent oxidoreductase [Agrilactobacillus fermenti]
MVLVTKDVQKRDVSRLFTPTHIGKLKLKNRTVMAPLGLVGYNDARGGFNKNIQELYIRRAKGGVGMITVGLVAVDYQDFFDLSLPCPLYDPIDFTKTSKIMLEQIHNYGTKAICMISAGMGRSAFPGVSKQMWAPSEQENRFDPKKHHRAMTKAEIQQTIEDYAKGALICKKAGFDGVEIHAVHEGYLLDQFTMAFFNQRQDEYGGSLENRLRLPIKIVKAIKAKCGADFPVSLRYSLKSFIRHLREGGLPGEHFVEQGRDIEEGLKVAKIFENAGYDMLNVDAGTYDAWFWNHPPMYFEKKGIYNEFGAKVKAAVNIPVAVAGRMDDPEAINEAFDAKIDLVEFGRPLLADPDLVNKIKADDWEDVRPCISCHDGCLDRLAKGLPYSCTVNPETGHEAEYKLTQPLTKKRVLVIGGGPAGLETAYICGTRGHQVTLLEAQDHLGGAVIPGSQPSFKQDDYQLLVWFERQLHKMTNVTVKLNAPATKRDFNDPNYDTIVVATGSKPIMVDFGSKQMLKAETVLMAPNKAGNHVTIIGGGLVGCETALWLQRKGKQVTVIEMSDQLCGGPEHTPFANWEMITELLPFEGVTVLTETKVDHVEGTTVFAQDKQGRSKQINGDTVICAVGYKANDPFVNLLQTADKETYQIGDAVKPGKIMNAIWDAYYIAKDI